MQNNVPRLDLFQRMAQRGERQLRRTMQADVSRFQAARSTYSRCGCQEGSTSAFATVFERRPEHGPAQGRMADVVEQKGESPPEQRVLQH